MSDLLYLWAQNSSTVFICFLLTPGAWILHLGLLAGVNQICLACLTLFCLHIDESCPTPEQQSSLLSRLCVWTWGRNCVDVCASVWRQKSGGDRAGWMPPPGEKMSGITAFSTQLTPKTDGASKHCSAANTMATACTRQQEACQANQRGEHIAI